MTRIPIKFTVKAPGKTIFNRLFARELPKIMDGVAERVRGKIKGRILEILRASPTYNALVQGPLDAHFGFHRGTNLARAEQIVGAVADSLRVEPRKGAIASRLAGGIDIFILQSDYNDLLSLPAAQVHDDEKNYDLPWLEWLLLEGDRIIIDTHEIKFVGGPVVDDGVTPFSSRRPNKSRSGKALMVSNDNRHRKHGHFPTTGNWRVPPEHSGTAEDNWLTRVLADEFFVNQTAQLVRDEIQRALS